jgi:hypothetical protein
VYDKQPALVLLATCSATCSPARVGTKRVVSAWIAVGYGVDKPRQSACQGALLQIRRLSCQVIDYIDFRYSRTVGRRASIRRV